MFKFIKITSVLLVALPLFCSGGASANTGFSLDGISPSGHPNFTNDVFINYQRANGQKYRLMATAEESTGKFNFSDGSYETVNNLSYKLHAKFDIDRNFLGGDVRINGNISGLDANGVLFKANLTDFATDGSLIGFDTYITYCDPGFAEYCTTNESVYLHSFGGGFDLFDKKFRADGIAVTTVPVPAAVWLFGSGLLGLISIARRKKTAA